MMKTVIPQELLQRHLKSISEVVVVVGLVTLSFVFFISVSGKKQVFNREQMALNV